MAKVKQTFLVSKFALEKGIVKVEAELHAEGKFITWEKQDGFPQGGFAQNSRSNKEFHAEFGDALIAAGKLQERRIKLTKKKLDKLKADLQYWTNLQLKSPV